MKYHTSPTTADAITRGRVDPADALAPALPSNATELALMAGGSNIDITDSDEDGDGVKGAWIEHDTR